MPHSDLLTNYRLFGCRHVACGRVLSGHRTAGLEDPPMDTPPPGYAPVRHVVEGARAYAAARGLRDPHDGSIDYSKVRTHRALLNELAHSYDHLPEHDPQAIPHFEALRHEVNAQYDHLTTRMGIKVHVTDTDPYRDVRELADDVDRNKRIKVLSTAVTGGHPFFSNEENDRLRAVHDVFGHLATGRDFDRHGEEAAYQSHARMFPRHVWGALASETRGQNASMIVNNDFGPQRLAIMPQRLWHPGTAHTASTYTVRLEHGRRRRHKDIQISPEGPMSPAYLQHPVGTSHVRVSVPAYDEHGDQRDWSSMDQEARTLAVHMTAYPADMVTRADIIHVEAARDWDEYRRIQDGQLRDYERAGVGGSAEDRDRYFGTGEMRGRGEQQLLTPKDWITHSRDERLTDMPPEFQSHWAGHELGYAHARAGSINHEELEMAANNSSHPDHFGRGYQEGLDSGFGEHRVARLTSDPGVLVKVGHVSGNNIDVLHCPFCGSGAIVARSDGSIECQFCESAYTVQVQPMYAAFPGTVNGQPYMWPGRPQGDNMPGAMGPDAMDPEALQGGTPGAEDASDAAAGFAEGGAPTGADEAAGGDDSDGGNPFAKGGDDADDGDDSGKAKVKGKDAPPFTKKKSARSEPGLGCPWCKDGFYTTDARTRHIREQHPGEYSGPTEDLQFVQDRVKDIKRNGSYRTATGATVSTEDFLRHLAITTASDQVSMIKQVKASRG